MAKRTSKTPATTDEIGQAIQTLSPADLLRLEGAARFRAAGIGRWGSGDWRDLLQEALARALEGRRSWDTSVPFVQIILGVMRSLASHEREHFEEDEKYLFRDADLAASDPDDDTVIGTAAAPSGDPSPEDALLASEHDERFVAAYHNLREHLKDDRISLDVFDGMTSGMTGPEIKEIVGLSQNQLETTVKRIRWRARKLFGSFDNIRKGTSHG